MNGITVTFVGQEAVLSAAYGGAPAVAAAARVCTASEGGGDADAFVRRLIARGHDSPLEFASAEWTLTTSRVVANQLVRHRVGVSFCQESTRHVGWPDELECILPERLEAHAFGTFRQAVTQAAMCHAALRHAGVRREEARHILPLCLATRLKAHMNMRSFRHFLALRLDRHASPDMRVLAGKMRDALAAMPGFAVFVEDFADE